MNEPVQPIPEPLEQSTPSVQKFSFVDRHMIHPLLFAFVSLATILFLYQVGGGILIFLFTGTAPISRDTVGTMRLLTCIGQFCFIFVPTLFLARLFAVRLGEVFPFRVPGIRESLLALVALFSLQRVFEAYMYFQNLVPLPDLLRDLIEPLKKLFEELTRTLVQADSPIELMVVIMVIAILPSMIEELLFRGLIQSVFERLMSPVVSAILAGTIFGLFHMNPFEIVPLIGLGVFFGLLRYRSQSLWLPMSAHFFNNLAAVLAFYYGLQDENLLSAAQTSIEMPAMIFEFVVFAALFFLSFTAYLRMTHDIAKQDQQERL
jgi:uncharacterized protein